MDRFEKERQSRRASQARRKLYMKETDITSSFLKELAQDTEYCIYCGCLMVDHGDMYHSKTLDHILPLSRGGKHMRNNVRYICYRCNNLKNNLFEAEFMIRYTIDADATDAGVINIKDIKEAINERFA